MSNLTWSLGSLAIIISAVVGYFLHKKMASQDNSELSLPIEQAPEAPVSPVQPVTVSNPTITTPTVPAASSGQIEPNWDTRRGARKATRVLCDAAGLTFNEKNVICACLFQESGFLKSVVHPNKDARGLVLSTDYGIAQINDYYHIGVGKDFPTVQYVLDNPAKCVQYMVDMYKAGRLSMWVSYTSHAYVQWLTAVSTDEDFDALLTKLNLLG